MLKDCLSSSERSRDTVCTTLCNREECVDKSDLGNHRLIRSYSFFIALDRNLNRLSDDHREFFLLTFIVGDDSHCITNRINTLLNNRLHCPNTRKCEWNEDFMSKQQFLYRTDSISARYFVSFLYAWSKLPIFIWNRIQINTTL